MRTPAQQAKWEAVMADAYGEAAECRALGRTFDWLRFDAALGEIYEEEDPSDNIEPTKERN